MATSLAAAPAAAPTLLASDGNTSALTTYGIGAMLAEKLSLNTKMPSTAIHGAQGYDSYDMHTVALQRFFGVIEMLSLALPP